MPTVKPRLFEFKDGKSDKFWQIELTDLTHTVVYGRTGTDGQTKTKEFGSESEAQKSYEKLIEQKKKKGYVEVDSHSSRSVQIRISKAQTAAHQPFLDNIAESPDELSNYLVYSDWLVENGDPLGEFIQVQIRLEDESVKGDARKKLTATEKKLLKRHASDWLPEALLPLYEKSQGSSYTRNHFEFQRGFLTRIVLDFDNGLPELDLSNLDLPTLRDLWITNTDYQDKGHSLERLAKSKLPNLKSLTLGDHYPVDATNVEKLLKKLPKLEELHLVASSYDAEALFKVKMPSLRELTMEAGYDYPLGHLAKNNSLAQLEEIVIQPHMLEPGDSDAYVDAESFGKFCKAKNLTSLKRLTVHCSEVGCEGVKQLVKAPFFRQLEHLDMSNGTIRKEGAALLAQQDLSNFKEIVLHVNFIDELNATKEFVKVCGEFYSVSAGEALAERFLATPYAGDIDPDSKEHLWEGSME